VLVSSGSNFVLSVSYKRKGYNQIGSGQVTLSYQPAQRFAPHFISCSSDDDRLQPWDKFNKTATEFTNGNICFLNHTMISTCPRTF
jgi:hypothetical protein